MVILSLELTRVNPDWNIFLIKCETKPYFFISMRFGSSSKLLILILTKWNWLIVLMCYINWFNFDWLVILIDLLDDINLLIRWFLLIDWLWLLYVEEREELKRQIVISGITTERPRNLPRDGGSLFCVSNKYFFIIFFFLFRFDFEPGRSRTFSGLKKVCWATYFLCQSNSRLTII